MEDHYLIKQIIKDILVGEEISVDEISSKYCRHRWCPNNRAISNILGNSNRFDLVRKEHFLDSTDRTHYDNDKDTILDEIPVERFSRMVRRSVYKRVS